MRINRRLFFKYTGLGFLAGARLGFQVGKHNQDKQRNDRQNNDTRDRRFDLTQLSLDPSQSPIFETLCGAAAGATIGAAPELINSCIFCITEAGKQQVQVSPIDSQTTTEQKPEPLKVLQSIPDLNGYFTVAKFKELLEGKYFNDFYLRYEKTSKLQEFFLDARAGVNSVLQIKIEKSPYHPKYFICIPGSNPGNRIQLSRGDLKEIKTINKQGESGPSVWEWMGAVMKYARQCDDIK